MAMPASTAASSTLSILSLEEVARLFGVTERTVRRWRRHRRRPLPAHRAPGSRRLYFVADEVDAWLRGARDIPYRDDPSIVKRAARTRGRNGAGTSSSRRR